ncbi:MAG: VWA domain-containing protein [Lewinellaceae bacterium]|nr:VWA domain-containing protein [Lewinellaceae bacterium]
MICICSLTLAAQPRFEDGMGNVLVGPLHFETAIPSSFSMHLSSNQSVFWMPVTGTPSGRFTIVQDAPGFSDGATITYTPNASSVDCGGADDSYTLIIQNSLGVSSDPLTLTGCKVPAAGTRPLSIVMVMDISGSMGETARCQCISAANGCVSNPNPASVSKLNYLKEKVLTLFTAMRTQLQADPNNRFGLVTFASAVNPAISLTPFNSTAMASQMNTLMNNAPGQGLQPLGSTAMGGGLKAAIDMLGGVTPDPSRARVILLMTNGIQNRAPMVNNSGGTVTINSTPSVTLNGTDIVVMPFAIFTPEGSYLEMLKAVSQAGRQLSDPGILATPYVCDLTQPLQGNWVNAAASTGSPKLLHFRSQDLNGNSGVETFNIQENMDQLTLFVSAVGNHNFNQFKVEKITGGTAVDITAMGTVIPPMATPSQHRVFSVVFPLAIPGGANTAGEYRMSFQSDKPGIGYDVSAMADDRGLKQHFFATSVLAAGQPLDLGANLLQSGLPVTNATVKAILYAPKERLGNAFSSTRLPSKYLNVKGPWGPVIADKEKRSFLPGSGAYIKQFSITDPNLVTFNTEGNAMKIGEKSILYS